MTRTLLALAALIGPGCDAAPATATDTVDPTDDSGTPDDGEPIEVVALEDDRVSFEVVGFDASPANLFHVLAAPTEPQPTLVALTVSNNGPTGEAHACAVSGRTLSSSCEVLPTDHHGAGFPFLADITGDGRDDLVIRSAGASDAAGFITVVPVAAAGFGAPVRTDLSLITPVLQAAGDFDDDGHLDITGTSGSAVGFSVLYGDGARDFPSFQNALMGQSARRAATVADFDGDGALDVAATGLNTTLGATVQIAFQE